MGSRTTWVGVLLLAGLLGFLWYRASIGADVEDETRADRVFVGLSSSDIDQISMDTQDAGQAVLERDGGNWRLTAPVSFPADAMAADGLASALASLDTDSVYDDLEPLAAYGLDVEPTVLFEAGERAFGLRIGGATPVGAGTYVTDLAGERVWVVPSWRAQTFEKALSALRDADIVSFSADEVTAFDVAWVANNVAVMRTEAGWRLTEPLEAAARTQTVDDFLGDLQFLRADGYPDSNAADAGVALAAPTIEITLRLEGNEMPLVVKVAPGDGADRSWVEGPNGDLYEVANESIADWPDGVEEFRFRELARFAPSAAENVRLTFVSGPAAVSMERDAERNWVAAAGSAALADGATTALLASLSRLEGIEIAAEAMGDAERTGLGLAPPAAHIQAFDSEGGVLADVAFGIARADGAIAAKRADAEPVYWVDVAALEDVPLSHAVFEARFRATAPAVAPTE